MKRKFFWIILSVALLLTGCKGDNKNYDMSEIYNTDEEYPAQLCWGLNNNIKRLKDTYYLIEDKKLYYWDAEIKTGGIVCSAANCDHNGEYCNGYLGRYGQDGKNGFYNWDLEIFNNQLYKIGYTWGDVIDFDIYSISLDGSQRTKMGYVYSKEREDDGGLTWWYDWVMINGYYYGPMSHVEEEAGLYKIRLDGEKEVVYDLSKKEKSGIHRIKGAGEYVYFEESWSVNEEYVYNLVRYNTKTNETETIMENELLCDYVVVDDERLIYSDIKGDCYLLDWTTGEEQCLAEEIEDIFALSFDGKYLFVHISGDSKDVLAYDLNGNLIDKIAYNSGTVLFGDENYLFIESSFEPDSNEYKEYVEEITINKGEGVTMPEQSYLWILDKSQLGNETKEWMKMELE